MRDPYADTGAFPIGAVLFPPLSAMVLAVCAWVLDALLEPINPHGSPAMWLLMLIASLAWLAYISNFITLIIGCLALARESPPRPTSHKISVGLGVAFLCVVPLAYLLVS